MVKNQPIMQETWVQSLGWEDHLEEDMATHSSILAGNLPGGERSLAGSSPQDCKELDKPEATEQEQEERKKYSGTFVGKVKRPWVSQSEQPCSTGFLPSTL